MLTMLRRFWFNFIQSQEPSVLNLGCGITAFSEEDAKSILHKEVFPIHGTRDIASIVADVDVSTLEEHHVRPNMSSPASRGTWFPQIK
jgi:hypothetical protein